MGFLDEAKNILGGSTNQNDLLEGITGLLKQQGGVEGLVKTFTDKGLGGVVSSWVSTGKNLPISADQIQQVLGSVQLRGLADKTGISTDDISKRLAEYLPQVVDKLTPDGSVPTGDMLNQGINLLKGKLFR